MCTVKGCNAMLLKPHVLRDHIPGIFSENLPCTPEVVTRRKTCLTVLAKFLNHQPDLTALVRLVNLTGDVIEETLSARQQEAAHSLANALGEAAPALWTLQPVNSIALLGHWRVLLSLFSLIDPEQAEKLWREFPATEREDLPEAIDSHFHVDRLCKRVGVRPRTDLQRAMLRAREGHEAEVKFIGGVANFCDPPTYPSRDEVEELLRQGVVTAIGIHPKGAANVDDQVWNSFMERLALPGVRGVGEVGLDYSVPPEEWAQQHIILDKILQNIPEDKVLVLHNRSQDRNLDGMQLLYQMKGVVPRGQFINLHCFSGSSLAVSEWIRHFPNIHFGFTPGITQAPPAHQEAIRTMDSERILLETDAPYFPAGPLPNSTPDFVGISARAVGEFRGEDWVDVLRVANANAKRLYNL